MEPRDLLRALLQIDTTNPPGSERPAADLLRTYLEEAGVGTELYESPTGRASVVGRIPGPSDVPSLLLVSHTDVVPVERDRWTQPPFGATESGGFLWGRGALDMKSIVVMHAAAVAHLARTRRESSREVIFVSVADEEAGGAEGMRSLLHARPDLLGFAPGRPPPEAIGEGGFGLSGIVDRPVMLMVAGEKTTLWLDLLASGDPGHGSLPPQRQANVNLVRAVGAVQGYRRPRLHPVMKEQFGLLAGAATGSRSLVMKGLASGAGSAVAASLKKVLSKSGPIATLLSDSITPTELESGYKHNVVPGEARAALDCRLLPDTDPDELIRWVERRCARHDVRVVEVARHQSPVSPRGPLFDILARVSGTLPEKPIAVPSLTSAMTDLRYLRERGATAYGWVPLTLDPELLATIHGHDERVPLDAFDRAVQAMTQAVLEAAG